MTEVWSLGTVSGIKGLESNYSKSKLSVSGSVGHTGCICMVSGELLLEIIMKSAFMTALPANRMPAHWAGGRPLVILAEASVSFTRIMLMNNRSMLKSAEFNAQGDRTFSKHTYKVVGYFLMMNNVDSYLRSVSICGLGQPWFKCCFGGNCTGRPLKFSDHACQVQVSVGELLLQGGYCAVIRPAQKETMTLYVTGI